jgi:hypothetical protein
MGTMMTMGKPAGMTEVALRLFEKAEAMPTGPRECLKALIPYLAENISICLEASQPLGSTPDLSRPIEDIVSAAHQTIMPKRQSGEATRAAWLFLEATQRTFQVLDLTQAGEDPTATFKAAMGLGQADVRLAQVWNGLWDIMAVSDANAAVAKAIAKARKAGGTQRGQAIAAKAKAWKTEALEIALARDAKRPRLNREQLALHIMEQIKGETVPNFKTVETWLRQEAEQPHGPIESRARRKPA